MSFWVDPSTTAWEKGLVKCHTSASQVLKHRWRDRGGRIGLAPPTFISGGACPPLFYLDIVSLINTISIGSSDTVNRSMKKSLQNFGSIMSILVLTHYL